MHSKGQARCCLQGLLQRKVLLIGVAQGSAGRHNWVRGHQCDGAWAMPPMDQPLSSMICRRKAVLAAGVVPPYLLS